LTLNNDNRKISAPLKQIVSPTKIPKKGDDSEKPEEEKSLRRDEDGNIIYETDLVEYIPDPFIRGLYKDELIQYPPKKILKILTILLMILVISLLKGNKHFHSLIGIKACGYVYWVCNFSTIFFCSGLVYLIGNMIKKKNELVYELPYVRPCLSYKLDKDKIIGVSWSALQAGFLGGMLGIGGGVILTPIWL
jgi:hypothetical protein